MDIDLLSKMVKELILDNDKVVLPGLGCFVAEIVPATFSDKGYTINPPYRKLYFRSKPDMDEMLVDFYASTNSLDREVACRILGDFISELRTIIHTKKIIVFPGLGRLRATKENNLFFIAEEDLDIYPAGFGLEPISLKTHQETEQEVSEAVVELKSILDETVQMPAPIAQEAHHAAEADPSVGETQEISDQISVQNVSATDVKPEIEEETETEETSETMLMKPLVELADEPVAELQDDNVKPLWKRLLIASAITAAVVILFLVAFLTLAHVAPEWVDSILYTPEELEILNRTL